MGGRLNSAVRLGSPVRVVFLRVNDLSDEFVNGIITILKQIPHHPWHLASSLSYFKGLGPVFTEKFHD